MATVNILNIQRDKKYNNLKREIIIYISLRYLFLRFQVKFLMMEIIHLIIERIVHEKSYIIIHKRMEIVQNLLEINLLFI